MTVVITTGSGLIVTPPDHPPLRGLPLLSVRRLGADRLDEQAVLRLAAACAARDLVRRAGTTDPRAAVAWLLPRETDDVALAAVLRPSTMVGNPAVGSTVIESRVVAVANLNRRLAGGYEAALLVDPSWRRSGVGQALMTAAIQSAAMPDPARRVAPAGEEENPSVVAIVDTDNVAAHRLAVALGGRATYADRDTVHYALPPADARDAAPREREQH